MKIKNVLRIKNQTTMEKVTINSDERVDDLQRNNLKIIQNPKKFCFGMDAVLLSGFAAVTIKNNSSVLDMCTGTGIIPILLTAKTKAQYFEAIEYQSEIADMAKRSVLLNSLEDKINIIIGDIKDAGIIKPASFDNVTCNPPYMPVGKGLKNPDAPLAIARHEIMCDLKDVIVSASRALKPGGKFYMVHRPNRLSEIFGYMHENKLEPKRMKLVYPFADKEPNMVLLEASKNGNPFLRVEKPLIVYKSQNEYTDEIYDIYGY